MVIVKHMVKNRVYRYADHDAARKEISQAIEQSGGKLDARAVGENTYEIFTRRANQENGTNP